MRSRTGCLTCRSRKLKCDEHKPVCGQCARASRECKPCPGITFRHQQNASLNSDPSDSLSHFFGYRETFDSKNTWVSIPKRLSFVHITDPYNQDLDFVPDGHGQEQHDDDDPTSRQLDSRPRPGPGQAAREHLLHHESPAQALLDLSMDPGTVPPNLHTINNMPPGALSTTSDPTGGRTQSNSARDLDFILNHSPIPSPPSPASPSYADLFVDLGIHHQSSFPSSTPASSESQPLPSSRALYADDDAQAAFLMRHFSEGPGHWMDLFDLDQFFAVTVPIKASTCPLLRHSAIALSAKCIARSSMPDRARHAPTSLTADDYLRIARWNYDRTLCLLRETLNFEIASPPMYDSTPTDGASPGLMRAKSLLRGDSDELVGTTAILCVYEFLDASDKEWSNHLDGTKSLFDIAKDGVLAMSPGSLSQRIPRGRGNSSRVAIFWNLARQDMLDTYIKGTQSRLDTSDLDLWRSVGLHISEQGLILPSNDADTHAPMTDDMVCNSLVWIIMQIVNFAAFVTPLVRSPSWERWHMVEATYKARRVALVQSLECWFAGLPNSFRPVTSSVAKPPRSDGAQREVMQRWFVRPMFASTMQWYHFARIQLLRLDGLLCRGPAGQHWRQDCGSGISHVRVRHTGEAREHALEILGIGLGASDEGVLVHSVQPLYAAGVTLLEIASGGRGASTVPKQTRDWLQEHMQSITEQTGWATDYRIQALKMLEEQWLGGLGKHVQGRGESDRGAGLPVAGDAGRADALEWRGWSPVEISDDDRVREQMTT